MEGTPRLYDTLVQVLSQHQNWLDFRHLKTLALHMMVGLIPVWPNQPHSLSTLCVQLRCVRAEPRASVCSLARQ